MSADFIKKQVEYSARRMNPRRPVQQKGVDMINGISWLDRGDSDQVRMG